MEHIHKEIGSCGPFQIVHVVLVQLTMFACVWSVFLMMFGNYDPGWKCSQYRHLNNISVSLSNKTNGTMNLQRPSHFNYSFAINETNTTLFSNNGTGVNVNTCDILDGCNVIEFDPNSETIVSEFNLICDRGYIPSIIISIQMMGMLVGSFVCGQIGESFGRKVSLYSSTIIASLSSLLAIFSPSWEVYAVFMFFCGAASSGIMITNGIYTMEFLQPKWRGILMGIPVWNVSLALFGVAIYVLRNWVYIHIASASITALACIGAFWTPESLRWLVVHKREKKAEKVVMKIMKMNNKGKDVKNVLEKLTSTKSDEPWDRTYTYLDLFRSREMCLLSLKMSVIWFFLFLIYFALAFGMKSLSGDFYINIVISGLSEIPVALMVAPIANLLGRRPSMAIFCGLPTLGCITIVVSYFTLSHDVTAIVITYSALFAKATIVGAVRTCFLFTVELYPTAVRSLAIAFMSIVSKVGSIIAPYMIPKDQNSLMITYFITGLVLILNLAIVLSLSETKNRPLQDNLLDRQISIAVPEIQTEL